MATKFTFRTDKPTGKWAAFQQATIEIKIDRKVCGSIETTKGKFYIRLMVLKDDPVTSTNPNCAWRWITLAQEFNSIDDAKTFLNRNFDAIRAKWNLATEED